MRPLRVFLCHASQDKPAVRKLHRYLKQHGVQPWLDQADLLPGENWEVEIPRAIYNSDVILVCLSKNSVNKEGYVQKEIVFALDKAMEKPEGTIFIIPAKLEECEVPNRLKRYQWVDMFRSDSNKRLLLGLNKRVASLGSDVLPVILEDTRQRKSHPKPVDISQIDRDTQEKIVAKADLELIEEALQEKLERETAEQAEAERLAREAKGNSKRETAEKTTTKAGEQEAREKVERATKEKATHDSRRDGQNKIVEKINSWISSNAHGFIISGIAVLVLLLLILGRNYIAGNVPSKTEIPDIRTSYYIETTTLTPSAIYTNASPQAVEATSTLLSQFDYLVSTVDLLETINNVSGSSDDNKEFLLSSDGKRHLWRQTLDLYRWSALEADEVTLQLSQVNNFLSDGIKWGSIKSARIEFLALNADNYPFTASFPEGAQVGFIVQGHEAVKFIIVATNVSETDITVEPLVEFSDGQPACLLNNSKTVFNSEGSFKLEVGFDFDPSSRTIQFTINDISVCDKPIQFSEIPSDVILYAKSVDGRADIGVTKLMLTAAEIPAITETPTITDTPVTTQTVELQTIPGVISATEGGGANLRQDPNGKYLMTLDNGTIVEIYPDSRSANGIMWVRAYVIKSNQRIEGWLLESAVSYSTPEPNFFSSETPVTSATPTP